MMRRLMISFPIATLFVTLAISAPPRSLKSLIEKFNILDHQAPLNPLKPVMPPSSETPPGTSASTGVIISDVIGRTQNIAIFSGLTRDIDSVSDRLDDASKNATVLAPDNGVMKGLKRKPWEDPKDYDNFGANVYDGNAGQDRAHKNLQNFVARHVVPVSPWKEGEKVKTLAGQEIWYETKEGKKRIQPGDVEVTSIADKVSNGEVWIINGVLEP